MFYAFLAGSLLYPMIEIGWRGRTHPAMALAGGISLSMLHALERMKKSRPLCELFCQGCFHTFSQKAYC